MAQQPSNDCDVTGKVGVACSRHGCFCPGGFVDLFQGEQQKNVDFAFLQSISTIGLAQNPEQGLLIIYDIACQYWVNLRKRIGSDLPSGLVIDRAIGMFHVHGHKDECFFRYAPSFIPGSAITSGEILESLWSGLNKIFSSVRTSTLAHRAEVLDDHVCDSNHKKALNMALYLCSRKRTANERHLQYKEYFLNLCKTFGQQLIDIWTTAIEHVEEERIDNVAAMDIYIPQAVTRVAQASTEFATGPPNLSTGLRDDVPGTAVTAWLEFALMVEEMQLVNFHFLYPD